VPRTYTAGATSRDQVRLTIADTSPTQAIFTDAEVDDAIARGVTVAAASAILLRTLAAAALRRGDAAAAAGYLALADALDPSVSVIEVGSAAMPFDTGFTEIT